jgi:hypothetical protein
MTAKKHRKDFTGKGNQFRFTVSWTKNRSRSSMKKCLTNSTRRDFIDVKDPI